MSPRSTRSKVAVIRVRPDHILDDLDRLHDLAEVQKAFTPGAPTILKDNISWHFPFPGANTTPWQLEGCIRALRARGFDDLVCVQNKTVVTDAFKGEDLNGYLPIFKRYAIPVRYNFKPEDMTWSVYRPKAKMLVLDQIFPEGIQIPDAFHGANIVHLPTVKCVVGSTELELGDGTRTTIRELVEDQLARAANVERHADGTTHAAGHATVFAMDPGGSIRACEATHFARTARGGRRVVRVTTRSGRALVATTDHPIFTPTGWATLGTMTVGARLAIARHVAVAGAPQPLPRTHATQPVPPVIARAGRKYSADFARSVIDAYVGGETVTAIAARENVRWQVVQSVLGRHGMKLRRNVVPIQVPTETSPAFWRWIGYFVAEGCTEDLANGAGKLWWTNTDRAIRAEFVRLSRELFGVEARERNAAQISIYSRDLVRFLTELGFANPAASGNKLVPPALFRGTRDEIAAFLSGYLDGDGHVSERQADVSATTKSERLAHDLVALFARLGVTAFVKPFEQLMKGWQEPRTYYRVTVAGAEVATLANVLTLRHDRKRQRLARHASRLADSKQPSNWDTVPLAAAQFRRVREGLGLTHASLGRGSSVNKIENGPGQVTGRIARELIARLVEVDTAAEFDDDIRAMETLANPDLAWDSVAEIVEVSDEEILYDITVPEAGSFVASGIVAHNCHIYTTTTGAMKNAFGGLLNTKRHYTHSWIHQTLVDLLAIQQEIHGGLFAVMDGTTAGDGPGPRTMRPVIKDVMLASQDQVAIDAVAAAMMGFDPMSIDYIRLADEAGLGHGKRENIEVVGDAHLADERWGFSVGDNGASMVGDLMWFGPLKRFQKLFFHTPLVNVFVAGSEAYHDYYRWPLKDKRIFEQWREQTTWGQLFEHYQSHGTLAPADIVKSA